MTLDYGQIRIGPWNAAPVHDLTAPSILADHITDINSDGIPDLMMHFAVQETGIACGDTSVKLTGRTLEGRQFEAFSSIVTNGCK